MGKGWSKTNANWIKVVAAAIMEVGWVIGLAHSDDIWSWAGTIVAIILSNVLLISAAQVLPAGTVYAVFVGLGTAGTVVAGLVWFGEPLQWVKVLLILVLLAGVVGLKLVTDQEKGKAKS